MTAGIAIELDGFGLALPAGAAGAERTLVRSATLRIAPGEIVGLAGPSGTGKTTLAHALVGHLPPGIVVRAGRVRVGGQDPFVPAIGAGLRARHLGLLGQDPASALNPARRLGTQLAERIARRGDGRLRGSERAAAVAAAFTDVGLGDVPDLARRRPHQVSGGQAQRAALAMAMAGNPGLVILDEPTSGLDPALARDLRQALVQALAGRTALVVSHDPELLSALAGRFLVLEDGELREATSPPAPDVAPSPRLPAGADISRDGGTPTARAAAERAAMPPALHAAEIGVSWAGRPVLDRVSLTLAPGSALAVLGSSGAGKTTLARVLAGLHRPDTGTVQWAGRSIERYRPGAVALVAQDSVAALNPREPVGTTLRRAARAGDRAARRRGVPVDVASLLARVGLSPRTADRLPHELSGGERQRVSLARALAAEPAVLILDEVTSALDAGTAAMILDLLADVRAELGVALVLVTHSLVVATRAAEEVAVIDGGRIVEHGPTSAVLDDPQHPATRGFTRASEADRPDPAPG